MSKKKQKDSIQQANNSQRLLIGLPIVITLVFSFAFIALNPHHDDSAISASSKGDKAKTKSTKPAALPPLPTSVALAQTLNTTTPTAPSTNASTAATSSPQPSSTAGASPEASTAAPRPASQNPQAPASIDRKTITKQQQISVIKSVRQALGR